MNRAETGPIRFGDDWAGVFIRGDNAFHYALLLSQAIASIDEDPFLKLQLASLQKVLSSCQEPCEAKEAVLK